MIDMTKLFDAELQRMAEKLGAMEPDSASYGQLLSNMSDLCWLADRRALAAQENPTEPKPDDTPAHVKEAVEEALGLDTPDPAAEPELVPQAEDEPAPQTERSYTKEEVRAALAESRKRGVKVTALLADLGYENFSAVPAGEYGAIMAKLGDA